MFAAAFLGWFEGKPKEQPPFLFFGGVGEGHNFNAHTKNRAKSGFRSEARRKTWPCRKSGFGNPLMQTTFSFALFQAFGAESNVHGLMPSPDELTCHQPMAIKWLVYVGLLTFFSRGGLTAVGWLAVEYYGMFP